MKLQAGHRVKFLNATGGGIVTRILDSRMVLVTDTDGFEIPTLISELVRIDVTQPAAGYFSGTVPSPNDPPAGEIPIENEAGTEEAAEPEYLDAWLVKNRRSEEILLAFVPQDQKWMTSGPVDVFLINNTSFDTIYSLFHRTHTGHFTGVDYGSLFAGTLHRIDTVDRETLTHWSDGSLQLMFHKDQLDQLIPPLNAGFRIDPKKFHKEGSYKLSPLIRAKGLLIRIFTLPDQQTGDTGSPAATERSPAGRSIPDHPVILRHRTADREAVVDLHIHELVEDPGNLDSSDILAFQKQYFLKCLDSAMEHHFLKVIFIHGVGQGVLRDVLAEELKKTRGIEWFDAPMTVYGVGAIEVRIPHNG